MKSNKQAKNRIFSQAIDDLVVFNETISPQEEFLAKWHAAHLEEKAGVDRSHFSEIGCRNIINDLLDALNLLEDADNPISKGIGESHRQYLLRFFTAINIFYYLGTTRERVAENYFKYYNAMVGENIQEYQIRISKELKLFNRVVRLEVKLPPGSEKNDFFHYEYPASYVLYFQEEGKGNAFYFHGQHHLNLTLRLQALSHLCESLCVLWNIAAKTGKLFWFLHQIMDGPCIEGATRHIFTIFTVALQFENPNLVPAEEHFALSVYCQAAQAFAKLCGFPLTISVMMKLICDAYRGKVHLRKVVGLEGGEGEIWQQDGILTSEQVNNYLRSLGIFKDEVDEEERARIGEFIKKLPSDLKSTLNSLIYSQYLSNEMADLLQEGDQSAMVVVTSCNMFPRPSRKRKIGMEGEAQQDNIACRKKLRIQK